MENERLYDIKRVCEILGTTSRTLRFYEEKGIIQSTSVFPSSRRHYTEKQIEHIKAVLVLRAIGLSVRTISELQNTGIDLKTALLQRRAELSASLHTKAREMRLLNEALSDLEAGNDILSKKAEAPTQEYLLPIARHCVKAILEGNDKELYRYISPKLAEYMPKDVYAVVKEDTFLPLGDFVRMGDITVDGTCHGRFFCIAKFSKMHLKITFHFCKDQIDGLWFHYEDNKKNLSL